MAHKLESSNDNVLNIQEIHAVKLRSGRLKTSPKHDIIESEREEEEVKQQETYTKTEIDLKFQNLEQKIESGFALQNAEIARMFSEFRLDLKNEQDKNKKEFTYWFIGLLVSSIIGIAAIVVTILTTK